MKRKREDDAINENVMALLTTCTSCSCQDSSSEHCYIHEQPVMFESDPKLLEESKKKKREYNKNARQDLRQKERLLLGKPTEDLTPEELEEVQKTKEKKEKHNLDQKNRYHSRREKAKENSLQNTEEVGANIAADDQLMDYSFSNNSAEEVTSDPEVPTVLDTLEAFKTTEASKADSASHDADEHDSYENMDMSESQTLADLATQESSTIMTPKVPKELTEQQKLRKKQDAKNAQMYTGSSNNAGLLSILEKEVKIRQKAQNWQRNLREKERILLEKSTEDLTPEELQKVQEIREKRSRRNQYFKNRYHSLPAEQRKEMNSRKDALKRQKAAEKLLQKTEEAEAKIGQDDQLLDDSFNKKEDLTPEELEMVRKIKERKDRKNLYMKMRYDSLTSEQKKERVSKYKALRQQKALNKSLQKTEEVEAKIGQDDQLSDDSFNKNSVESRDSTSHDSHKHESNENVGISKSKTFADSATPDSRNTTKTNLLREDLTELQKIQRKEVAKRNYSELSEEKTKGLSKREERDNNLEPLDEKNLKMLLDIIQSLEPAAQERDGAE